MSVFDGALCQDVALYLDLTAGSIRGINIVGGTKNCVNCSIATDATLAGHRASALLGGPYRVDVLENFFCAKFGEADAISKVIEVLTSAGAGARGIVFGMRSSGVGHVFNAVNQKGVVRFLDGQTGYAAALDGYTHFRFLRTN